MRVLLIVQARVGSRRLPGKVLMPMAGRPMLAHVLERAKRIDGLTDLLLTTPLPGSYACPNCHGKGTVQDQEASASPAVGAPGSSCPCCAGSGRLDNRSAGEMAVPLGYSWWPDDHSDLLACFIRAARDRRADAVVRITGDCPLLDPIGSSAVVREFLTGRWDYCSNDNVLNPGVATDGYDTEVVRTQALEQSHDPANVEQRHHVTAFIRENTMRFRVGRIVPAQTPDRLKLSVDTQADYERVRAILERGAL